MTTAANELSDPLTFMRAGRAVFTVQSRRTQQHFTFRMKQIPGKPGRFFVSALDRGGLFLYIGLAADRNFICTPGSKLGSNDPKVKAFIWVWNRLHAQKDPQAHICHEGKCGRCGRRLTHPESLASGIGPECAKR